MKIKAAIQFKPQEPMEITEVELEEPEDDEVLVKIIACGVCRTDIKMQNRSRYYPFLLGHEGSGIIEKTGRNVNNLSVGDHVIISYTYCGECDHCKEGHTYDCKYVYNPFFIGFRKDGSSPLSINNMPVGALIRQGTFAEYAVCSKNSIVKVDKNLDLRLIAPFGCGFMTGAGSVWNYLKPEMGKSIVIMGAGGVGSGAVMAAKICGCNPIIVVDRNIPKLDVMKDIGATHTINTNITPEIDKEIQKICGEIDYAFDCTGNGELLSRLEKVLNKEACTCGVGGGYLAGFKWQNTDEGYSIPQEFIPQMIKWYQEGNFPIDKLIRFYPLDMVEEAMEASRKGEVIKPVLVM